MSIYQAAIGFEPVVAFKQNLGLWTNGKFEYYRADHIVGIPPGPASTLDFLTQAPVATVIAANGTLAKRVGTVLQVNDGEMVHFRWEPVDPVEGLLWEKAGQEHQATRSFHSRVDQSTRQRDPYLATTTFFVYGLQRDADLEVRNPLSRAVNLARFIFWGYRYILTALDVPADKKVALEQGDPVAIREVYGPVTLLPAEGRQA